MTGDRDRPPARAGPRRAQHLAPPGDLRAREPRRRPATASSTPRCGPSPTGTSATCSTSAAAPASTSPASPSTRATVIGVEPHPPLVALARRRTRRLDHVEVRPGTAQALPLPDASVDVVHARWAYFFGPGCEPGLRELDRVVRRGGTAFVVDNDGSRSTFGRWFRQGYPTVDPDEVERFWSAQGWQRVPARHRVALRDRRGPRGGGAHRARPRDRRARRSPSTTAPWSTTPSTSGGAASDPLAASRSRGATAAYDGQEDLARRPASGARSTPSSGSRAGGTSRSSRSASRSRPATLLERLAHRGQPRRHDLRGQRVVEADDGDVVPGRAGAALVIACSTPIAMVSLQHTNADGLVGLVEQGARPPAARTRWCPRPGALRPVVDSPCSCMRSTQPLRRSSPMYDVFASRPTRCAVCPVGEVVDGEHDAGAPVDVDPRVGGAGAVPRAAEGDERHLLLLEPRRLRVAAVGVGDDEGVDGRRAQQVVVPASGSLRPRR